MSLKVVGERRQLGRAADGHGSGDKPSARLRLASDPRLTGPAIQRAIIEGAERGECGPDHACDHESACRNGPQPAVFRLAGRRRTKPVPGRLSIFAAPATR